jgi:hypothetical protein
MELDFAFLADGAEALGGKLYVMGGAFDTIWGKKFPAIHPKISFVMRMTFEAAELDRKHHLEILLMDEDGKNIAKMGGPLEIKRNPKAYKGWPHPFLAVMNFINLSFPKAGDYSFNIVCNNTAIKSVPLRIASAVETTITAQ